MTRALVAAENEEIKALIVLNKCDLTDRAAVRPRAAGAVFGGLGYRVLELSARDDAEALRRHCAGDTSVLVGQSGMGKSTLINALVPGSRRRHPRNLRHASTPASTRRPTPRCTTSIRRN